MKADLLPRWESTKPFQELLSLNLEIRGMPEIANFTNTVNEVLGGVWEL